MNNNLLPLARRLLTLARQSGEQLHDSLPVAAQVNAQQALAGHLLDA
jgi:hypothetical protein